MHRPLLAPGAQFGYHPGDNQPHGPEFHDRGVYLQERGKTTEKIRVVVEPDSPVHHGSQKYQHVPAQIETVRQEPQKTCQRNDGGKKNALPQDGGSAGKKKQAG